MHEPKRPDRPAVSSGYSASSPDLYLTMRNGRVIEPGDEENDRILDGRLFPLDGDTAQARRAAQDRERD